VPLGGEAGVTMPSRLCLEPGCTQFVAAYRGRRSPPRCAVHQRQWERRRGTSTQRGYGWQHRKLRADLLAVYQPTDPCARCGGPLGPNPDLLDLGHVDGDRSRYRGLEHRECNRGRR
jgi:hypothetical protein